MAIIASLIADVKARTGNFTKGMTRVRRDLDKTTKKTRKAKAGFVGLAGSLRLFSGAAVGLAFMQAARGMESFNSAMSRSLAIMGDVSKEMRGKMEQAAVQVARTTTSSAQEAARAYFFLASAGMNAEQSLAAMPTVAKFAEAGQFDLAQATDLLADAQSAMGLSAKNASLNLMNLKRVAGVLVKANTMANATVVQFSQALTAGFATELKAANQTLEEGVAVLTVFANKGIKAERASTLASQALRVMKIQASQNAAAYKDLNVNVFDHLGMVRPLSDIVADVSRSFKDLSHQEQAAALSTLGFTVKTQLALNLLIDTEDQLKKNILGLQNFGDILDDVTSKSMTAFEKSWARFKADWFDIGKSDIVSGTASGGLSLLSPQGALRTLKAFINPAKTFGDEIRKAKEEERKLAEEAAVATAEKTEQANQAERAANVTKAMEAMEVRAAVVAAHRLDKEKQARQISEQYDPAAKIKEEIKWLKILRGDTGDLMSTNVFDRAMADLKQQLKELDPAFQKTQKEMKRLKDLAADVFEGTRTPFENLKDEIKDLNKLLGDGMIDWETFQRAASSAADRYSPDSGGGSGGGREFGTLGQFTSVQGLQLQGKKGKSVEDEGTHRRLEVLVDVVREMGSAGYAP